MSCVIGIDLGTTNTCVSILDGHQPRILENSEGGRTTPSMVAFTKKGNRLVGQPAKRQMVSNSENTLLAIKRLMGHNYDDSTVQDYKERVSFDVVESANGDAWVKAGGKEMSPAEVSAVVLQKMKQTAELFLGEDVTQAVVTVPAYFNDTQRQATRDAGRIAGLEVLRIVNEPTAAALAFGLEKTEGKTIAVYDLGGGTFDISILEINNGIFHVKSTNGDTHLGGVDFDQCVMTYIVDKFEQDQGIDLRQDRIAMQRIREAAENVRIELSSVQQADINLPFIHVNDEGPKHLSDSLTRTKLEALVAHLIQKTLEPCQTAMQDAGIPMGRRTQAAVDEVILVGGMTRMPKVQETVAKLFGKEPHRGVNPDEVVAMGAAIQGGVLSGEIHNLLLLDVTPFSLGIRTKGGGFSRLIEKNEPIPCKMTKTFTTARNWQTQVTVMVAQGEEMLFENNKPLSKFVLDGLPIALRGTPKIDVTFAVDADGMVKVSAQDKDSGREQSMQVEMNGGLTDEEIQQLVEESKRHAKEDALERSLLDNNSEAESLVDRSSQLMAEHGKKLENHLVKKIESSMANLRSALDTGGDSQTIITQTKALQDWYFEAAHKVRTQKAIPEETPITLEISAPITQNEDFVPEVSAQRIETCEIATKASQAEDFEETLSEEVLAEGTLAEETLAEEAGSPSKSVLKERHTVGADIVGMESTESMEEAWDRDIADTVGEMVEENVPTAGTKTSVNSEEEAWLAMAS